MAFLHSAQLLYTDCGYPRWSVCFTLPNAIFFYMLFNDFYKVNISYRWHRKKNFIKITFVISIQKSYTKKGKAKAAAAKLKSANGKTNGHITHDINHNEVKKDEEKKGK